MHRDRAEELIQWPRLSRSLLTATLCLFDEELDRHYLTQEINLSNSHLVGFQPLSQATRLPSARKDSSSRHLMLGVRDNMTLGNLSNPSLVQAYFQYRGEPSLLRATKAEAAMCRKISERHGGKIEAHSKPGAG